MAKKCNEIILWFIFVLVNICHTSLSYRPCMVSPDPLFTGNLVDCSHNGMVSADIPSLRFENVSSLILNNNNIGTLRNKTFRHFDRLKRLEMSSCSLQYMDVDALSGLGHLQVLILENNYLRISEYAFPYGCFRHVPQLEVLNIGTNDNVGHVSNYSEFTDLFHSLHNLVHLEIDSFVNLRIGREFSLLKHLSSLRITCNNLVTITNDSLFGLKNSTLKHFALLNGHYYSVYENEDCDMLFQNLPNSLSSLNISHTSFGNRKILSMLKPIIKLEQLDILYFDSIGIEISGQSKEDKVNDRGITANFLKYLKHVCVNNFVWLHNYALSFDLGELTSYEWKHCLRSFTYITGGTDLYVDSMFLAQIFRMQNLRSFIYRVHSVKENDEFWRDARRTGVFRYHSDSTDIIIKGSQDFGNVQNPKHSIQMHSSLRRDSVLFEKSSKENIDNYYFYNNEYVTTENHEVLQNQSNTLYERGGFFIIRQVPPYLTNLVLDRLRSFSTHIGLWFKGKNSFRSMTLTNAVRESTFTMPIVGLNMMEEMNLTNSAMKGNALIFKQFPSLKKLIMKNTNRDPDFLGKVAESVPKLEYFDISENSLFWLPDNMFESNKNLRYLCLASNRFTRIPFHLALTPNLEILDLRENSIIFTSKVRQAVDDHSRKEGDFYVLIENNQFSCACSGLHLLKWLQDSEVHCDHDKDYVCMTSDGGLSRTSNYSDTKAVWRHCSGQSYFLISLTLASTLMTLYLATFLFIMHKTRILNKALQIVVPGFRPKVRQDYLWDVVIGYADQDGEFVRLVLLPYLEERWHLKTFVHQRDLLQDPLLVSYAIQNSWRNLLIITEHFLDRCQMAHNIMKVCSFFVNPTNPKNVIVMVEKKVQTRIPDYVLQIVDEDNIIVLPTLPSAGLDYETKETIKTRILE